MKARYIAGACLMALLVLIGCDDNTGSLGMGMLPDSDGIAAHTASFNVVTRSVKAEKVFSKTSTGYIGRFSDPEFGYYESSFLSELNCTDDFNFPAVYKESADGTSATGTMAGDSVVSIQLVLFYSSWFGDSLNACRMSVYELNDQWLEDRKLASKDYRYTDFDVSRYYDESTLLGRKAYSAYDESVPDSVRTATDSSGNNTFYPNLVFPLDKELGSEILRKCRENNGIKDSEDFINHYFKGIYAKSDYGDGTILYIDRVDLQVQFRLHVVDEDTGLSLKKKVTDDYGNVGEDSLVYSMATAFASTKEVIQANKFANQDDKLQEKLNETDCTYIKSPAGIFTEATMPYDEIYEQLGNDTLNAVKLTFTNQREKSDYAFSMSAPSNVLLIRKTDYETFFSNNELPDNVTSYVVAHNNVATNQYTFGNIARLVSTCINEKKRAKEEKGAAWDEEAWKQENPDWDRVLLLPVTLSYDNSSSASLIGIQNDLKPGYAKLKGGPAEAPNKEGVMEVKEPLKLEVIYTVFAPSGN